MTKAVEAKASETIVEYDVQSGQSIPLTLTNNGKETTVRHILGPLSDERYFQYQKELTEAAARFTRPTTALHEPIARLWNELAQDVEGYKPRDDFKAGVHSTHKKEAIGALCDFQLLHAPDDAEKSDELWDIDEPIVIHFRATFGGVLLTDMSHTFRPESASEMDEYLAIESNLTNSNELASAQKLTTEERMARLGLKLLVSTTGYKNGSHTPSWHLTQTTQSFFIRQALQAGKFLA